MSPYHGAALVVATFLGSLVLTRFVREHARRRRLLDNPNERSSHAVPKPRLGGVGVLVPFLATSTALCLWQRAHVATYLALVLTAGIAAVGLLDDLWSLPARWRFGGQVLAAATIVAFTGGTVAGSPWLLALPPPLRIPLLVLWVVWLTNLYNFMDGIDGLAGGQGVLACAALAVGAFGLGADTTGWLLLCLGASLLGFLVFNFPPASIFMGDVGSTAIGFFLACVPLLPGGGAIPIEAVGLALALFILDATVTLVRRVARGERWFEAHRTHYYQRPVGLGISHRAVTVSAYLGMAVVGAAAAVYPGAGTEGRVALLGVGLAVFLVGVATVRRLERRESSR